MMKKILSLILSILIMASCITVTASQTPMINISSAQADAGETVEINLSLKNNPGIINMRLFVNYDKSALELIDVNDKNMFGASVHGNDLSAMPYVLCWANDLATENYVINDTIVTLKFKIKNGASSKSYPVSVTYDNEQFDIFDCNFNPINFTVSPGSITVKGNPSSTLPSLITLSGKIKDGNRTKITVALPENAKGKVGCMAYYHDRYVGTEFCDASSSVTFSVSNTKATRVKVVWWSFTNLSPYSEVLETGL